MNNKQLLQQLAEALGKKITIHDTEPEFKFEEGKVYWNKISGNEYISKFNCVDGHRIRFYWAVDIKDEYVNTVNVWFSKYDSDCYRLATPAEIQEAVKHLPDGHEDKPKIATTMEGVIEEIQPAYFPGVSRECHKVGIDCTNLPTEHLARKSQAFTDILNLCEYLNGKFEWDGGTWAIHTGLAVHKYGSSPLVSIYHFTSEAAAVHALTHFKPIFETFYS